VGEGDIVDANNSGHGCTYAQFEAKDTACTENEVNGGYFVNYKAEPKPGWRFVRWDGPCSPGSDFQHCRFDIPEHAVAWWDETHEDKAIPPSKAVFQPVQGETGYLLAGTPVAGVTYETKSQTGTTGLDGSFQYEEGETIRFTIAINWALQDKDNPYHTVTNITVLLQSLDHDNDPDNGIVIMRGVASLLNQVKLDVKQPWDAFQDDLTLHHLLGRANRSNRFSVIHGIVKPSPALDHLYRALEIDPRTVGLSVLRSTIKEEDGAISQSIEHFNYDTNGNLIGHDNSAYGQDAYESWQYDNHENVTLHEAYADRYGYFRTDNWQYDANDNMTRYEVNSSGEYTPEHEETSYVYDDDGNRIRALSVRYRDKGDIKNAESFKYDYYKFGNLQTVEHDVDNDADGYTDHRESTSYDVNSNLIRVNISVRGDGSFSYLQQWEYDANNNPTRSEWHAGGDLLSLTTWQYDASGKMTRQESQDWVKYYNHSIETFEYDVDGFLILRKSVDAIEDRLEYIETWEYDDAGNVTAREILDVVEARVESRERWTYDFLGNVVLYECESDCDDVFGFHTINRLDNLEYHANGNLKLHRIKASGIEAELWAASTVTRILQYDVNGNLSRDETDIGSNGQADRIETWHYDAEANLTRNAFDEYGDGTIEELRTYEYVPSGWGYLFSGIEVFGYSAPYGENYIPPLRPQPRGYSPD
jgi:hypothetical protein